MQGLTTAMLVTTSTDICEASFPLLQTIRHRRFVHAVYGLKRA